MVLLAREEKCLEYWWGRAGDIEKLKKTAFRSSCGLTSRRETHHSTPVQQENFFEDFFL